MGTLVPLLTNDHKSYNNAEKYLDDTGSKGKYYKQALELLNKSEKLKIRREKLEELKNNECTYIRNGEYLTDLVTGFGPNVNIYSYINRGAKVIILDTVLNGHAKVKVLFNPKVDSLDAPVGHVGWATLSAISCLSK